MKRWLLLAIAALATAGFTALGVWQVERRAWKLALIERVEQRIHAAPVAAPGPAQWPALTAENAEYRRVTATGHFLENRETLVRAVTELGEGFWLMEPLQTDEGFVVLVNRGFVPQGWRGDGVPEGTISITGLLRLTEPHGAFLRSNAPAENRWYSRDVEAISQARHLTDVAPYFIDAEAHNVAAPSAATAADAVSGPSAASTPSVASVPGAVTAPNVDQRLAAEADASGPPGSATASAPPVAGLTVVHFRNAHLQYAITWFILALMALALGVRVARAR